MCFSSQASFGAAGILVIIGSLTLNKMKYKREIPLSLVPYFFATQQTIEGLIWIALQGNNLFSKFNSLLTYSYLFFALPFWPLWIPISVFCIEKNKNRKRLILLTLIAGIGVAIYTTYLIILYGVKSEIICNHVFYHVKTTEIVGFEFFFYLVATILPFFISSISLLWIFGVLGLISLYISYLFYLNFFLSVWCFFAAILSIFIYFVIRKQ